MNVLLNLINVDIFSGLLCKMHMELNGYVGRR